MMHQDNRLAEKHRRVRRLDVLTQVYELFDARMKLLSSAGLNVPKTPTGQHHFVKEACNQLFDTLSMVTVPHDDSIYPLIILLIPDLLFARLDHLPSDVLSEHLRSGSLKNWNKAMRLIEKRRKWNTAMTFSDAMDVVEERVNAEIGQHRPVSDFFKVAVHAH